MAHKNPEGSHIKLTTMTEYFGSRIPVFPEELVVLDGVSE